MLRFILITILICLSACSSVTPPLELAPNGEIVQKAIALQLHQTEQRLASGLKAARPELEIARITVKTIDPLLIAQLPTYHLQGTYDLTLKLLRQQKIQRNNAFDLYLQRQAEGKTWRLLTRDSAGASHNSQWSSYLIR